MGRNGSTFWKSRTPKNEAASDHSEHPTRKDKKQISALNNNGTESGKLQDASGTAPLTFFTPDADKLTCHPWTKLIEKYDPGGPTKIPPEVLAVQGKISIFQFHFNSLANTTDFTLDEVFNTQSQDPPQVPAQTQPQVLGTCRGRKRKKTQRFEA
ncbi:hypothetical protein Tco_1385706 [Tanacetum coccineum]